MVKLMYLTDAYSYIHTKHINNLTCSKDVSPPKKIRNKTIILLLSSFEKYTAIVFSQKKKKKKNSSVGGNRSDGITARSRVGVGHIAAIGSAADDAVVRDLEVVILHADGVVAVGALGRVGYVCP